jgi:hypothetical protein
VEGICQTICAYSVHNFPKIITQRKQRPIRRKFAQFGVDVMITILCDFCQFSAKKLAFFLKTNAMIKILHNLPLFRVKNANFFAEFFGENILKIITSVPGVEVMITIFCDFCQFSAKKLAFFLNTNVMINFFQNLALFRVKNANYFAEFFGENIFRIITSVPGHREDAALPLTRQQTEALKASLAAGLPDFSWYMIPKQEILYQMNTSCTKWSLKILKCL